MVAWTHASPALECTRERARLGEAKRKGDVSDRAARVFYVTQREVSARVVDQLEVGGVRLGELALQRARAHVELLRRMLGSAFARGQLPEHRRTAARNDVGLVEPRQLLGEHLVERRRELPVG